jgi:streptogramin lyase
MLVYVVDGDKNLLSFSPADDKNEFKLIGKLDCPAGPTWPARGGLPSSPFSMSVDRQARAWVLYGSGEIFWVDTKDASCNASTFSKGASGYELFGMGFAADQAGSSSEKLFIAGGDAGDLSGGNLAQLDPTTMTINTINTLPSADLSPELTGTGNGDLYAYFPGLSAFVAKLNKSTGAVEHKWNVPAASGSVRAWAFAHWGGKFYIFVTTTDFLGLSENSQVIRLDPSDGSTQTILSNIQYRIVGAGVSTCAPVVN